MTGTIAIGPGIICPCGKPIIPGYAGFEAKAIGLGIPGFIIPWLIAPALLANWLAEAV
jgi:hypothetical protein